MELKGIGIKGHYLNELLRDGMPNMQQLKTFEFKKRKT